MLDLVELVFGTRDVYAVLNNISSKDATDPKKRKLYSWLLSPFTQFLKLEFNLILFLVRAGYLRAALAYHPDKASPMEKDKSTQKFQILTKIYEVLKDDDNRKAFEETGIKSFICSLCSLRLQITVCIFQWVVPLIT